MFFLKSTEQSRTLQCYVQNLIKIPAPVADCLHVIIPVVLVNAIKITTIRQHVDDGLNDIYHADKHATLCLITFRYTAMWRFKFQ